MTEKESTAHLARRRLQRLLRVARLGLFLCPVLTGLVSGAEESADPYDDLYDVLMTRYGPEGVAYGADEPGPAIYASSAFPFDDGTYETFTGALNALAALPQVKIEGYSSIQRALLQRHLWKVFDASAPVPGGHYSRPGLSARSAAARPKIVALMRRLALPKADIQALPNTLAATVKSGGFSRVHDPGDPFKPFLPADLYSEDSSWVCMGRFEISRGRIERIPALVHSRASRWRSAFLIFMRAPGGRDETLDAIKKMYRGGVFPAGTQFAFVERAFLISDEGELTLSPLIASVSLRAHLDVERSSREASPDATQCVAEFVIQPRQLMRGNAVMKALAQQDHRFERGDLGTAEDPFVTGKIPATRLNRCLRCHGQAGLDSLRSRRSRYQFLNHDSPEGIIQATSQRKRHDYTWVSLRGLWRKEPEEREPPQPPIDTPTAAQGPGGHPPGDRDSDPRPRGEGAAAGAAGKGDPYNALYDVIMTRQGEDGKSYAEDESSPSIFPGSAFPFDDRTFKKLKPALDAFAAVPKEEIEVYSDVKRALMQRHLWQVFDATLPLRGRDPRTQKPRLYPRPHQARRDAVRPMTAALVRRLALTREQILGLPNTLAATVKSGRFSQRHDPRDRFRPFLPADLYEKESSWVCLGGEDPIPAELHTEKLKWRSAFYTFLRLPGGRQETLEYLGRANRKDGFPVGAQFALIEQAFLISDRGERIPSPLIVTASLRAYLDVNLSAGEARPAATQCVAEFVLQPRQLLRGNAVMKALSPVDHRFEAGDAQGPLGGGEDPFETGEVPGFRPRLDFCMSCHSGAGQRSVLTGRRFLLRHPFEISPAAISESTSAEKQAHETWTSLQEIWRADPAP